MLYGGHVKAFEHIDLLRELGFDFGEVVFRNAKSLLMWSVSSLKNPINDNFFLIAHGPFEGPPNDMDNLRTKYFPALKQSVDVATHMMIEFLTVHLWMDRRFVKPEVIEEKKRALEELVGYGRESNVQIGLENLSEDADDLARILDAVPGLVITLDIGHGQLITRTNTSFRILAELIDFIRHVHLHDNRGGNHADDDLHLPIGQGVVDYPAIITALLSTGYDGTMTLELAPEALPESKLVLESMIRKAREEDNHCPSRG